MKLLFTSYFNVSIIAVFLVAITVLLRLIFKRASKSMQLILWSVVILRLLIPFQLPASFSLRPEMPALQNESTSFFAESELLDKSDVPAFVPQVKAYTGVVNSYVWVDYVELAGYLWISGVIAFVVYMLISYLRLKWQMREAVRIEGNIYESSLPETAFLLGYFRPNIYVPSGMNEATKRAMILHEETHRKLGHNWLKLAGFVVLSLHWYNPLVWLMYILLCEDIEYACDEITVRGMSVDQRKRYSAALIACGDSKFTVGSCPVAFGEINIRSRIKRVLNYRKPTVWIVTVTVAMIAFIAVFFVTDPAPRYPEYYKELIQMVGQPKSVVTSELGITLGDELAPKTGIYKTPLKVNYEGVDFELELGFSVIDDCLWSFRYVAAYENDREKAARDTVDVTKRLIKSFGTAEQNVNKRTLLLSEIDVPSVLEKFENKWIEHEGVDTIGGRWDLTGKTGAETKAYWDGLVNSEYWKNVWKDRKVCPDFALKLSAWCQPDENVCYLIMDFDTGYSFEAVYTITD